MLSNQLIQINWPKIKSVVLSTWNELSETEVEKTHGRASSLQKLVEEKYGNGTNFDQEYEKICGEFARIRLGREHTEMDIAEKSMDKDRDDEYLTEPNGVTIPIRELKYREEKQRKINDSSLNETTFDGYNNADLHFADYTGLNDNFDTEHATTYETASDEIQINQDPHKHSEDISQRRSNSSASTTSHPAHSSSDAMSRDTNLL